MPLLQPNQQATKVTRPLASAVGPSVFQAAPPATDRLLDGWSAYPASPGNQFVVREMVPAELTASSPEEYQRLNELRFKEINGTITQTEQEFLNRYTWSPGKASIRQLPDEIGSQIVLNTDGTRRTRQQINNIIGGAIISGAPAEDIDALTQALGEVNPDRNIFGQIIKAAVIGAIQAGFTAGISTLVSTALTAVSVASSAASGVSGVSSLVQAATGVADAVTGMDIIRGAVRNVLDDVVGPAMRGEDGITKADFSSEIDDYINNADVADIDPVTENDASDQQIEPGSGSEGNPVTPSDVWGREWWKELGYPSGPQGQLDAREDGWRKSDMDDVPQWDEDNIYGDGLSRNRVYRDPITGNVRPVGNRTTIDPIGPFRVPFEILAAGATAVWDWVQNNNDHVSNRSVFQDDKKRVDPPENQPPILGSAPRIDEDGNVVGDTRTEVRPPVITAPTTTPGPRDNQDEEDDDDGLPPIVTSPNPPTRGGGDGEEDETIYPPILTVPITGPNPPTDSKDFDWDEWERRQRENDERRKANIGGVVSLGTSGSKLKYKEGYAGFAGGETGRSVFTGPGRYNNKPQGPTT